MKTITLTMLTVLLAAVLLAADAITKQERKGTKLVVTYADGRVVTNSLFLAVNPDVKREINRIEKQKKLDAAEKNVKHEWEAQ